MDLLASAVACVVTVVITVERLVRLCFPNALGASQMVLPSGTGRELADLALLWSNSKATFGRLAAAMTLSLYWVVVITPSPARPFELDWLCAGCTGMWPLDVGAGLHSHKHM